MILIVPKNKGKSLREIFKPIKLSPETTLEPIVILMIKPAKNPIPKLSAGARKNTRILSKIYLKIYI